MNKTTEMIVFRSRETGKFLKSYKDRGSLASEVEPIKRDRSSIEDMIKYIIGGLL